jgi:hypothetical protein
MKLFNLFRRPSRPAPVRRARLFLESLDGRICPDGNDPLNPGGSLILFDGSTDNAPVITQFGVSYAGAGLVTLSGTVSDENPGGCTVTLHGIQSEIDGQTVTVFANGTFSTTVTMQTDGSDDGTVTAQAKDAGGQVSNEASVYVHPR